MNLPLFTLLQIAIGVRTSMGKRLDNEMWQEVFKQAKQQVLLGVTYGALEKLPKEERPPFAILAQWFAMTQKIEQMNSHLNVWCEKVEANFGREGFAACILKGQGIAQLYPQPLRRQCGDIDVWLVPNDSLNAQREIKESLSVRRKKIVNYVQRFLPNEKPVYHHIDFNRTKDVSIEVHFTPSWMNHPCDNARLQRWFTEQSRKIFGKDSQTTENTATNFTTPTTAFNMVYVLLHIYRHIFNEGVGLRQVMDYYFVVKNFMEHASDEDCKRLIEDLKRLHLFSFSQAVMYVLEKVFALPRATMPCEPDEIKGEFLLQEILRAGNFGQHDERLNLNFSNGSWKAFIVRSKRNLRFIKHYPREVIFSPLFKLWHQSWLRWNRWN